jgi:predicted small secreted protein
MKRFSALALILLSLCTAACNTMEGLGEDVQKGGENIEDAANN